MVVERGSDRSIKPDNVDWSPDRSEFDHATYVERLVPAAKTKLLMFAGERKPGWDMRTWVEEPTS